MENKKKMEQTEKHLSAKEGMKAIQEIEETTKMENIVKDNKIVFKSGSNSFRVRKPTLSEQQEVDAIRRKKYMELVADDSFLFRKQWIENYKKKGIDINKMDDDIKRAQGDYESLLLRLAKTADSKSIELLKKEIDKTKEKMYSLSLEKTDLLVYSIEDQLLIHVNSYVAYRVLEKQEKDKWIKPFNSYEDFEKSENHDLINKTFSFINHLMYGHDYESNNTKKNS